MSDHQAAFEESPELEGYRLSPQQQRLWLLRGGSPAFQGRIAIAIAGALDPARLKRAVERVVSRHEILRTAFRGLPGMDLPLQVISPAAAFDWQERVAQGEGELDLDIAGGSQPRFSLLRSGASAHLLVADVTSLAADARSLLLLAEEIAAAYGEPEERDEPDEPLQYCQFAEWQHQLLAGEVGEAGTAFWRRAGLAPDAPLPFVEVSADGRPFAPLALELPVAALVRERIAAAAASLGATVPLFVFAGFQALLFRLTRQTPLSVGFTVDGRQDEDLERALGLFAESLPVPLTANGDTRFSALLEGAVEALEEAREHAESFVLLPATFAYLFEELALPAEAGIAAGGLVFTPAPPWSVCEPFTLKLTCRHAPGALALALAYDSRRLDPGYAGRLGERLLALLGHAADIARNPEATLDELALLGPEERGELAADGQGASPAAPPLSFLAGFAAAAARDPHRPAVELGDASQAGLAYGELDRRSDRLAERLRGLGAGPEVVVGICAERGLDLVVGLLGIVKSGAAYLPLEPSFPDERLAFLLADAGAAIVVTQSALAPRLGESLPTVLLDLEPFDGEPAAASPAYLPEGLAYLIYTSGSTGRPKGVMVTHGGLANYLGWAARAYEMEGGEGSLFHTSIAFDLTVTSVLAPLAVGQKVIVVPEAGGPTALATALKASADRTVVKLSPAHLRLLARQLDVTEASGRARAFVIGGEALWGSDTAFWSEVAPDTRLINEYGPTETVVGCAVYELPPDFRSAGAVPIGRPIANTRIHLLDAALGPIPAGVTGELYVGGPGVARGYLGRPDLTAEKFVPDPFAPRPGERLYRTGDVARRRFDGEMEFQGRADGQVKIRGYRVEPGEIEALLLSHPAVAEAAVLARDDGTGERRLVAYVAPAPESRLTGGELRQLCREKLPEFMVPQAVVLLPALPLTAHGKIDRKALPEPDRSRDSDADGLRLAPRTPEEEILAGVFCQVLRLDDVGADENFFSLGGDSIRSIEIVALARERGLAFTVDDLFRLPTLRQLAVELAAREAASLPAAPGGPFALIAEADRQLLPDGVVDAYPLTMLQAGMIFHAAYAPDSPIYHDITTIHFKAPLNLPLLRRALEELVARHPTLRTTFDLGRYGEPLQLVHRRGVVKLGVEDLSHLSDDERRREAEGWLEAEKGRGFDIGRLPLVRFHLQVRTPETFQFFVSFHHAILDGWSEATMLTELFHQYRALTGGEPADLAPPATPFRDFLSLERAAIEEGRAFWEEKLAGAAPSQLPRWRPPLAAVEREVYVHQPEIPEALSERVKKLALELAVPLKSLLLAAHLKVLAVQGGDPDVLTAMVSSGRPESRDGERVLGLFINSLPVRVRLGAGSFRDLVLAAFAAERELVRHRRYPWAELKHRLGEGAQETVFYFTHYHIYHSIQGLPGIELIEHGIYEQTSFTASVNFYLDPWTDRVRLTLKCNENELPREQVEDLGTYYVRALEAMTRDPQAPLGAVDLLSENERHQLLVTWNDTAAPEAGLRLDQLIASQAARDPLAVAVRYEGRELTRGELERRANRLAHRLRRLGVGPETVVAVVAERSLEMVVGLLAVLKAGGAYLPIDPEYPRERQELMLRDAGAPVLLGTAALLRELRLAEGTGARAAAIDDPGEGPPVEGEEGEAPPENGAGPGNLAYVIYTSGSTGRPKGVLNTHRGIVNRLLWMQDAYGLDASDRVLQKTPLGFDVSVWELFWPLLAGARLVVARPGGQRDSRYLAELFAVEGITTAHFVPSMLRLFLDEPGLESLTCLRRVVASGEALPAELVERFHARFRAPSAAELHNLYGPTEAAVDVTAWPCARLRGEKVVPIGHPIANVRIHLLDRDLGLVPLGTAGELHIGGVALARGYLGQPELTAERFIPDPWGVEPGARLYKTGDLARRRADRAAEGAIEFLGRIDHQVKVRGFRIELGEVEAAILEHPAVGSAAVAAREDLPGTVRLVAYLVPARPAGDGEPAALPSISELRSLLAQRLPEYMLPAVVVALDALPLSVHGKVDRRRLPAPDPGRRELDRPFMAPRNEAERLLARVWSEVLRVDRVGVDDNFFDLGGDSILSTMMAAKAGALGLGVTPRQVFEHPTVARLAAVAGAARRIEAEQGPVTGPVPLTPVQHWFFEQELETPEHFNQALLLAARRRLDPAVLDRVVGALLAHHDALRLRFAARFDARFAVDAAGWSQSSAPISGPIPFLAVDLGALPAGLRRQAIAPAVADLQASLDLGSGPLLRAAWFAFGLESEPGRLALVVHHLAVDALSWRVLLEDLASAYLQASRGGRGGDIALPLKTTSFKRWAELLGERARTEAVLSQLAYWTAQAPTAPIALPVDFPGGDNRVAGARTLSVALSPEETAAILEEVPALYRSRIDEVLLAALALAFAGWAPGVALAVDLEGHGREELFENVDLARTVGWFTSIFPVFLPPADGLDPGAALTAVKERLRAIPDHGTGYGLLRYLSGDAGAVGALSRLPRPQVLFNYLGQLGDLGMAADQPLLTLADESITGTQAPGQARRYLLEINARVEAGQMQIVCRYGGNVHRRATVERLAEGFADALRALVAHGRTAGPASYSPADFTKVELTREQLANLLDGVEL
jgi:amino acid adenylation domain-containing protein/non-ribosomal peptide synthase protein (TIGR01720 family)